MEADALEFVAGSNVSTLSESVAGSSGGLRCGEQNYLLRQEKFGESWKAFVMVPFISKEIWKCEPMMI